ncbi:transglutaminase-like domain-containing protein [Brooklawnia cerclae]|uniref:Transglutaminase-like putative cysteine protease n=1 Tax=Brooklawnia cerclae TaxID=349934 RepID=A0ABX0SNI4_9ACTN|nr:transglutaminase-like putative cysteine protease [Brooklawnia cerclae]
MIAAHEDGATGLRPSALTGPVEAVGARRARPSSAAGAVARLPLYLDAIGLAALAVALVIVLLPAYGNGWVWVTVLGGTALGMGLALISARRRWNASLTALVGIGAWFVLGSPLAMPDSAIGFVVPTLRTLEGLATGPVTAWRDMLTIAPPLGTTWNLMTVPLLLALVSGLLGTTIARRSSAPTLAWVPSLAACLIGFLLGTHHSVAPLAVAIGIAVVVLVWTTAQRARARTTLVRTASRRRLPNGLTGALVLAVCTALTVAAAPFVDPQESRVVLRELVEQPLDVRDYASPLQGFRANISEHENDVIMTVDGAPASGVIRVATLDAYDGLTYNVSNADVGSQIEFLPVGARIEDPTVGEHHTVAVTIGDYSGVWLPNTGATLDVEFLGDHGVDLSDSFYHNMGSGTSIVTAGLTSGDSYVLEAVSPATPTEAEIRDAAAGSVTLPEPGDVPDRVRDLAAVWTSGASSAGDAALMLADRLSTTGWFSHGVGQDATPSLPGHSFSRLSTLLADEEQMVGDEEQYAVAMALMCRVLGIPARVVYGYTVPEGGSGEVHGSDVGAWTEVYLDGLGWVMFDPTPAHDRVLKQYDDSENPQTRPHVENPPPPPERPEEPPSDNRMPVDPAPVPEENDRIDLGQVLGFTAVVGLPVVILLGPIALVLGLKHRRRKMRMNAPEPAGRVAGGWAELLDQARDLGTTMSPSATRTEQAERLAGTYGRLEQSIDTIRLARQADASTFAPDPVSPEQAASFWEGVDQAIRGLRDSVTRRRAVWARLSPRSFRTFR